MLQKLKTAFVQDLMDIVPWAPAFMSIGILIYFRYASILLPLQPLLLVIFGLLLLIYYLGSWREEIPYYISVISILIVGGIIIMAARVQTIEAPVLSNTIAKTWTEGTIIQIQKHASGERLWLKDPYIEDLDLSQTPKLIRIIVRGKQNLQIGDTIGCLTILMPPQAAILPDKFDFAEYAYFKQLGAIGSAISNVRVIDKAELGPREYLQALRHAIALRILAIMPQPAAGVAIGLLIGDTSFIEAKTADTLRISGIAHLVAISGMHMVIIVGMIFCTTRWLLGWSSYIILHYNSKKLAAVMAILGSFCYLLLAGSPISAQRAFIVSALVLIAIVLDQKPLPMRILMLSGICILLATPEAVKNPSLQMSFAACIGLIATSEKMNGITQFIKLRPYKLWRYLISIIASTLVASIATAPFLIYHFGTFSTYSALTNVLAIPLNDFAIMLTGVMGILLMPLHLEYLPLMLMGKLIGIMLWLANNISELNGSFFYINSFTSTGLFWVACGGLVLALSQSCLRYGGILMILIGCWIGYQPINADVIVAAGGKIFVVNDKGEFYFSNKRSARYIRNALMQYLGIREQRFVKEWNNPTCHKDLCILYNNNHSIAILGTENKWQEGCANHDVFVNLINDKACPTALVNIGKTNLEQGGTHLLTFGPSGVLIEKVTP